MNCRNCEKEIGNNVECGFCGYNSAKDDNPGAYNAISHKNVKVAPVSIVLKKEKNGCEIAGFVLSFFSFLVIPFGLLSFILSLVGFFKAKRCRTGRIRSILTMVVCVLWAVFWICVWKSIAHDLGL